MKPCYRYCCTCSGCPALRSKMQSIILRSISMPFEAYTYYRGTGSLSTHRLPITLFTHFLALVTTRSHHVPHCAHQVFGVQCCYNLISIRPPALHFVFFRSIFVFNIPKCCITPTTRHPRQICQIKRFCTQTILDNVTLWNKNFDQQTSPWR